jgi:hypothetical protein
VATNSGFAAYTGVKSKNTPALTPIEKYSGVSSETRRKLAQTRVTPSNVPASAAIAVNYKSGNERDRRAQLFR